MRKSEYADIKVSTSHVVLRTVLFAVALIVAIAAITVGVTSLRSVEKGYANVPANADGEATFYAADFSLCYYFSGSNSDNRLLNKELTDFYSRTLARLYRLFDAENLYTGYTNLAYLNRHPGEEVALSEELYSALKDAYGKTLAGEGYNLFAGQLYTLLRQIGMLEEPQPYDPLLSESIAALVRQTAERTSELSDFRLEFLSDESYTVRFSVADRYLAFAEEAELTGAVLDLSLYRNAYILSFLVKAMEESGYTAGYLSTTDGIAVSLSGNPSGAYLFYREEDGRLVKAEELPMSPRSSYVFLSLIPVGGSSYGYYTVESDGLFYRSPWFLSDGSFPQTVMSVGVKADTEDPVGVTEAALKLFFSGSEEEARTRSEETEKNGKLCFFDPVKTK